MKLVVFSDIHGSLFYASKLEQIIEKEKPDKLILLGDLYYHGPRNPLTEGYAPQKVAEVLNKYSDKIIAIKGNCDAEVDEMISKFTFKESEIVDFATKKIFLTHGHKYNLDNLPNVDFDIMLYGHFHTGFIHKENGKIFANPGSISLPKNNTKNSYIIITATEIILKDVDGEFINSKSIDYEEL